MMARDRDGLPLVVMAAIPLLALEIGFGFVRFQMQRRQGVQRFRRELLGAGMTKGQAARLARAYHEAGSVRRILHGTRFPGM